jgi:hypothetical protein
VEAGVDPIEGVGVVDGAGEPVEPPEVLVPLPPLWGFLLLPLLPPQPMPVAWQLGDSPQLAGSNPVGSLLLAGLSAA